MSSIILLFTCLLFITVIKIKTVNSRYLQATSYKLQVPTSTKYKYKYKYKYKNSVVVSCKYFFLQIPFFFVKKIPTIITAMVVNSNNAGHP